MIGWTSKLWETSLESFLNHINHGQTSSESEHGGTKTLSSWQCIIDLSQSLFSFGTQLVFGANTQNSSCDPWNTRSTRDTSWPDRFAHPAMFCIQGTCENQNPVVDNTIPLKCISSNQCPSFLTFFSGILHISSHLIPSHPISSVWFTAFLTFMKPIWLPHICYHMLFMRLLPQGIHNAAIWHSIARTNFVLSKSWRSIAQQTSQLIKVGIVWWNAKI